MAARAIHSRRDRHTGSGVISEGRTSEGLRSSMTISGWHQAPRMGTLHVMTGFCRDRSDAEFNFP
jgi:hypothetical protein